MMVFRSFVAVAILTVLQLHNSSADEHKSFHKIMASDGCQFAGHWITVLHDNDPVAAQHQVYWYEIKRENGEYIVTIKWGVSIGFKEHRGTLKRISDRQAEIFFNGRSTQNIELISPYHIVGETWFWGTKNPLWTRIGAAECS